MNRLKEHKEINLLLRYKKEFNPVMQKPDLVFPVNPNPEMVKEKVRELIGK